MRQVYVRNLFMAQSLRLKQSQPRFFRVGPNACLKKVKHLTILHLIHMCLEVYLNSAEWNVSRTHQSDYLFNSEVKEKIVLSGSNKMTSLSSLMSTQKSRYRQMTSCFLTR